MPKVKQVAKKIKFERFASPDAENRYNEIYADKEFLSEVGFNFENNPTHPVLSECLSTITALQWDKFCAPRFEPELAVVRDFYSNLWPNNVYSVFVRDKHVPLNPTAISNLFNLPPFTNNGDEYFNFLSNMTEELSITLLHEVTKPGTTWTKSKQGDVTCLRTDLLPEAKVWFYFLRHSLMPTGHSSSLNLDKVVLLACIIKHRTIDVGRIICEQIRQCASKKSGDMFFPNLICLLCQAARVTVDITEDEPYAPGVISAIALKRILPVSTPPPPVAANAKESSDAVKSPVAAKHQADAPAPVPPEGPTIMLQTFYDQQRLFWTYVYQRDAAYIRSLPRQRQRQHNGVQWPAFPTEILPTIQMNLDEEGTAE